METKINEENSSNSHIQHVPEFKYDIFNEEYPKSFRNMNNMLPIKAEPSLSSVYKMEPIDQHSNSANLFKQNDNSYEEINETKVEDFQSNYMMESFHVDSNCAGFLMQNDHNFDEIITRKVSKRNIMLLNK